MLPARLRRPGAALTRTHAACGIRTDRPQVLFFPPRPRADGGQPRDRFEFPTSRLDGALRPGLRAEFSRLFWRYRDLPDDQPIFHACLRPLTPFPPPLPHMPQTPVPALAMAAKEWNERRALEHHPRFWDWERQRWVSVSRWIPAAERAAGRAARAGGRQEGKLPAAQPAALGADMEVDEDGAAPMLP